MAECMAGSWECSAALPYTRSLHDLCSTLCRFLGGTPHKLTPLSYAGAFQGLATVGKTNNLSSERRKGGRAAGRAPIA